MPNCAATFSAVWGIEPTPHKDFVTGLTKRQPIVVFSSLDALKKACPLYP
jgi:hypothetical protein